MQWQKQIITFEERFYTSIKQSVLFLCSVFSLHKCRVWRGEKKTRWWYAQRKHNSKPRKSCELWLRVNSIATGWFKFMLGKSFIFSFLRRIWDKSLNTWKTRKFKQCVFLSFHSGNFSFVIHFSPTAPWSLGAHMGCGKTEDAGRCIIWLGKTTSLKWAAHTKRVSLSSNCKFQFSWKRRPQICKSLLRVLRWIRLSSLPLQGWKPGRAANLL